MTLLEIIQAARAEKAEAFGKVADKRAVAIVRAVLDELGKQVKDAQEGEGDVTLAGFGKFVVKKSEVEKDGKTVSKSRVVFRPAKAKKKKSAEAAE